MRVGAIFGVVAGLGLAVALGLSQGGGPPEVSPGPAPTVAHAAPLGEGDASSPDPEEELEPAVAAALFQAEVLRHLQQRSDRGADGVGAGPAGEPASGALAGVREPVRPRDDVDHDYIRRVQTGRISGIPNERRAGLTLVELDRLGPVPYFEALRESGQTEELQRLGLDLPTDWEACGATGTCWDRPDGQWRPPDAREPEPIEQVALDPTISWDACLRDGSCYDRPDGEWRMPSGVVRP